MERNARIEIASILGIWHALTKSSIEVCFFLVSLHQRDDYVSSGDLILLKQKKKERKRRNEIKRKKLETRFYAWLIARSARRLLLSLPFPAK